MFSTPALTVYSSVTCLTMTTEECVGGKVPEKRTVKLFDLLC